MYPMQYLVAKLLYNYKCPSIYKLDTFREKHDFLSAPKYEHLFYELFVRRPIGQSTKG